jgi:hypothetical protein
VRDRCSAIDGRCSQLLQPPQTRHRSWGGPGGTFFFPSGHATGVTSVAIGGLAGRGTAPRAAVRCVRAHCTGVAGGVGVGAATVLAAFSLVYADDG